MLEIVRDLAIYVFDPSSKLILICNNPKDGMESAHPELGQGIYFMNLHLAYEEKEIDIATTTRYTYA